MNTIKIAPVAMSLFLAGTPALFALDVADIDSDGDGMITIEEFAAAFPDLTPDEFTLADTDADGLISGDELSAAAEAGILPAMEG